MKKDDNPKRQKIIDLVNSHVKKGGNVLEISCGHGKIIARLKEDGYVVRGTNYLELISTEVFPMRIIPLTVSSSVILLSTLPIILQPLRRCLES